MKRLTSLLLALCLALPLMFGQASAGVVREITPDVLAEVDVSRVEHTSSDVLSQDEPGVSPRRIDSFHFQILGDGSYTLLLSGVKLQAGQTVTVEGTWGPPSNPVWVRLSGPGLDRSMSLTPDRKTITFNVPNNGQYSLWVSTFNYTTEGTLNVTW